jgi:chemotaxis protein MotB
LTNIFTQYNNENDLMQITRLQNAIKVTVNSELLFPSGDWQMPVEAQQTIGKIVPILAPKQQTKIQVNGYTDNVPIGPGLMRQGVTSNLELSQKRADNVMQFMISRGVNPSLVERFVNSLQAMSLMPT